MAKSKDLAKYEFRKRLEEIQNVKGRATELISLYVPPNKRVSDVTGYLKNEYAQSSNIKSRTTRKNVMWAIESITGRLKTFKSIPENGLVFLVGYKSGSGDQTEPVTYVLEPPEPISTFMYRCDSHFYLEQLEDMLTESEIYGLIVIDRTEATVGILNGKRIEALKNFQSRIMGKHRQGGQSAQRFERLIEIAAHEYYKKVADLVNETFMAHDDMKGVLIGGPGSTKDIFAEKDYLHHELKKKVLSTLDTGYTDEAGLRELVENATKTLEDLSIVKEKKLMKRFFEELRKPDGGLSSYGEEEVRRALETGAVDTLIISEGLDKHRVEYSCPDCGSTGSLTIDPKKPVKCPDCDSEVKIMSDKDIVNEMFEVADSYGTNIEMISMDSEEGEMLMKAFNGLAAILRFRTGAA